MNSATSSPLALTAAEQRAWNDDGFFVRLRQFDGGEVGRLRAAVERACETARTSCVEGRTYRLDGRRFVDVGHRTVQFEYGADTAAVKVIEPVCELEPALDALVEDPRLMLPIAGLLGTPSLALWTDKLNLKRPGAGTGFGWHQDSPYWVHDCGHVDALPNVMVALDDADAGNGCFRVIRGSHRDGCLPGTADGSQLGGFYTDPNSFDEADQVLMEVPAGSLIFFSPHTVHGSGPNESSRPRRALVLTYQPGGHPTLKSRRVRDLPPIAV